VPRNGSGAQANGRARVVFVTAYDEHAVAAFEHGAIDYVPSRFLPRACSTTVSPVEERLGTPPAADAVLDRDHTTGTRGGSYLR